MKRIGRNLLLTLFTLFLVLIIGPRPNYKPFNAYPKKLSYAISSLDSLVQSRESGVTGLRSGNEAKIIWHDSVNKQKTPFSLVYLHGFSASHHEGYPLHEQFARRFGCNLYLSRLKASGVDDKDAYKDLEVRDMVESAKDAIAVGKMLGEKVIVMATSTGATYAAYLAGEEPSIHSLIFYSPNIDLFDGRSDIMLLPWGKEVSKLILGGEYRHVGHNDERKKYWTDMYHIDGIIAMKYLLSSTMTNVNFQKIKQPVFLGCYYKDEVEQDSIVSVAEMRRFYDQLGTPPEQKRWVEFPDAGQHIITSPLWSDNVESVKQATFAFAEEILKLQKSVEGQEMPVDKRLEQVGTIVPE